MTDFNSLREIKERVADIAPHVGGAPRIRLISLVREAYAAGQDNARGDDSIPLLKAKVEVYSEIVEKLLHPPVWVTTDS